MREVVEQKNIENAAQELVCAFCPRVSGGSGSRGFSRARRRGRAINSSLTLNFLVLYDALGCFRTPSKSTNCKKNRGQRIGKESGSKESGSKRIGVRVHLSYFRPLFRNPIPPLSNRLIIAAGKIGESGSGRIAENRGQENRGQSTFIVFPTPFSEPYPVPLEPPYNSSRGLYRIVRQGWEVQRDLDEGQINSRLPLETP